MKVNPRTVGRLLIVEDNAVSRRAMETLLRLRGWQVSSAATLAEALTMLDPAPDCIILDLMLPDGCGESVLELVRERNLHSRVIVTTGCHDVARNEAVARLRPHTFLHKPLDFSQVCRACRMAEPRESEAGGHMSNSLFSTGMLVPHI